MNRKKQCFACWSIACCSCVRKGRTHRAPADTHKNDTHKKVET